MKSFDTGGGSVCWTTDDYDGRYARRAAVEGPGGVFWASWRSMDVAPPLETEADAMLWVAEGDL